MHWRFWWRSLYSTNRCLISIFSFLPEAWMVSNSLLIKQQRLGFIFGQGQLFSCLCIVVLSLPDISFLFFGRVRQFLVLDFLYHDRWVIRLLKTWEINLFKLALFMMNFSFILFIFFENTCFGSYDTCETSFWFLWFFCQQLQSLLVSHVLDEGTFTWQYMFATCNLNLFYCLLWRHIYVAIHFCRL